VTDSDPLPSLDELGKKLEQAKKKEDSAHQGKGMAMAFRLGAEFASGAIVGVLIGSAMDKWFDTAPLFLILCMIFGTAAGVKTMMQTVERYQASLEEEDTKP